MSLSDRIVIIGGGIIGSLTALFLRRLGHVGQLVVLEPDPTYRFSSTALSAASIRSQFGTPVNVELSLFGIDFLRSVETELGADTDIGLVEDGYLILGDTESLSIRREVHAMQRGLGADVVELDAAALAGRFPWLNTDGVAFATYGVSGEGWFDAWALLQGARRAAIDAGAVFQADRAVAVKTSNGIATGVTGGSGKLYEADWIVNAAGALSAQVAEMIGGSIPVAPRKRTVFHFKAPLVAERLPMLFDKSGVWFRPEGDGFIGGIQPDAAEDFDAHGDFEPHHHLFEEAIWPLLAQRVPALEQIRLLNAWAGHYEMNLFDHNGIVGRSPDVANFLYATGFSGHGVMHAPGVARGIAELLMLGTYRSIDLSPLSVERIVRNEPLREAAVY